ncbi:MAG TPA: TonB-dependent receptor [Bryobacteraceae bacterium]|nr:TonB-dependent receptor [Bryobacteraceae bacterium]
MTALRMFALCTIAVAFAVAQTGGGELRLTVRDASGAPMAAHAALINQATRTEQQVDLAADGRYTFKNLPFGLYRLEVSRSAFAAASELIEIRSELPVARAVTLSVLPIATAVEVTESDTLVDPDRTATAYSIGERQVRERPSGAPGRDLIDLVAQQPGWILEANGVLHPRESEYDTQYVVNGFPVEDNRSPAFAPGMEADDVQAVRAYTGGIPAEFGRKLGGIVEVTTDRNSSPGFRGTASLSGGSFATMGGFLSGQYTAGRTTATLTADVFATDRYLDPPVQENFTNHGSGSSFTATLERDLDTQDRIRISASRRETHFLVPDELLQEAAGQRQDRASAETAAQFSWQRVFSPELLGSVRAMFRDTGALLWSNPLATPISAQQDRGFRQGYAAASLAGHHGRHEWKVGSDFDYTAIREAFSYNIVDYSIGGVPVFDPDTPPALLFRGHAPDREQSAYAQDVWHLGPATVSAGLRFDHYDLLVKETAFSPRLGASWNVKPLGLVLRASYDRVFGTPAIENILLSASPLLLSLNDSALYLPVRPSRGNYYEAGFTRAFARRLRLDASFFRRDVANFADDDVLLNTGVSFPIAYRGAQIQGVEVKIEAPRWGRFSGFLSYSNMTGIAQYPIAGGLFLDDNAPQLLASTQKFPISQDQRNTARALVRCQVLPRLWTSWSAAYNSGLPVDSPDQSLDFLTAQYGAAVVSRVNFDASRVRPSFALDASVGADLWRKEHRSVSVQADALNLTDRLNVINFAGLLSGTALAAPRSYGVRLRLGF